MRSPSRHGAALIIAMIVLVMLMMLGIPFVMSQSASIHGSTAFRGRQQATTGRDTAEELGIGLAVQANAHQFSDPERLHSKLDRDLEDLTGRQAAFHLDPKTNRLMVDASELALGFNRNRPPARIGLTLEDESGRLDVNSMDASAWHKLLEAAGIPDWDDNEISGENHDEWKYSPRRHDPETDAYRGVENDEDQLYQRHDIRYGELAEALARVRYTFPENRITRLEQLLDANPNTNDRQAPHSSGRDGKRRKPLTPEELDVLRPYLTVFPTAQGRGGVVDLGTVIGVWRQIDRAGNDDPWRPDRPIYDGDLNGIVGAGSSLVAGEPRQNGSFRFAYRTSYSPDWSIAGDIAGNVVQAGTPVGLEVKSPVNINQAAEAVRYVLLNNKETWPGDKPPPVDASSYAALRDVATPGGWASSAYDLLEPFGNALRRDTIPISLRSWGLVRIDAGAAAEDLKGRPVSSAFRSLLVQAGPQEQDVQLAWNTQHELLLLAGQRHGSRLATGPVPVDRFFDQSPSEVSGEDDQGYTFQILPNWATITTYDGDDNEERVDIERGYEVPDQITRDWSRRFNERTGQFASMGMEPGAPASGQPDPNTVKPDGVELNGAAIDYRLKANDKGPLTKARVPGSRDDLWELDGRHISLWLKPTDDFSGQAVTLLEVPALADNQMPAWDGSPHSGIIYQNHWRLYWDGRINYLVFELANPAIEHRVPYGHLVPEDDFTDATLYTNEQSLGSEAGNAIEDLAPVTPELGRKLRYFYKVTDGLEQDRWYHLQLVVAHDKPGGQSIILDGLVGRNANTLPVSEEVRTGDHVTMPSLVLAEDLPNADLTGTGGGPLMLPEVRVRGSNVLADINGGATNNLAEQVLARRGIILIGNEYISYETINGDVLENCYRALRTNTNTNATTQAHRFPIIEQHFGDSSGGGELVLPSGYRFQPHGAPSDASDDDPYRQWAHLYAGGTTTNHIVGNGDPRPQLRDDDNQHRFRTWISLSVDEADYDDAHKSEQPPDSGRFIVWIDNSTAELVIQADADRGHIVDLPPQGLLRIGRKYVWYGAFDGATRFTNLTWLDQATFEDLDLGDGNYRGQVGPWRVDEPDEAPTGYLTSIEVGVQDDITAGQNFPRSGYVQIEQTDTGRIEWLRFHRRFTIVDSTGLTHAMFYNRDGWNASHRGRQRTIFAGLYNELSGTSVATLDPITANFPAEAKVLPVQNAMRSSHWMATGDVVTILPVEVDLGAPERRPTQAVIRYAATDGYPSTPHAASVPTPAHPSADYDTKNEWFAFTTRLPAHFVYDNQDSQFELISGMCWSGQDTSALNPIHPWWTVRGLAPRIDGMMANYSRSGTWPVLRIGNDDQGAPFAIDALVTGRQPGASVGNIAMGVIGAKVEGTLPNPVHGETELQEIADSDIDFLVLTNHPVFHADRGLILVNGEVMAYQRQLTDADISTLRGFGTPAWTNNNRRYRAKIIGRGLLGTKPTKHRIYIDGHDYRSADNNRGHLDRRRFRGLDCVHLPIGPVGRLASALPAGHFGRPIEFDLVTRQNFREQHHHIWRYAPAVLLAKQDGSAYEIAGMVTNSRAKAGNSNRFEYRGTERYRGLHTAPWMRGLYHTVPQNFAAGDLVIGYWPKYPSVLPATDAPSWSQWSNAHKSAAIRSRTYAWASISARFKDCLFPNRDAVWLTDIDDGLGRFSLFARAMPDKVWTGNAWTTFDWNRMTEYHANTIGSVFSDAAFNEPSDGAEVKLIWRYTGQPIDGGDLDTTDRGNAFFVEAAANANATPRLGGFGIKVRIPTTILESRGHR